jgi:hypothetical protein
VAVATSPPPVPPDAGSTTGARESASSVSPGGSLALSVLIGATVSIVAGTVLLVLLVAGAITWGQVVPFPTLAEPSDPAGRLAGVSVLLTANLATAWLAGLAWELGTLDAERSDYALLGLSYAVKGAILYIPGLILAAVGLIVPVLALAGIAWVVGYHGIANFGTSSLVPIVLGASAIVGLLMGRWGYRWGVSGHRMIVIVAGFVGGSLLAWFVLLPTIQALFGPNVGGVAALGRSLVSYVTGIEFGPAMGLGVSKAVFGEKFATLARPRAAGLGYGYLSGGLFGRQRTRRDIVQPRFEVR